MCNCIQITATPQSTGIQETVDANGVLVDGFNQYNFILGEQEFVILWDGEQWSLFAVVPGPDIFIGSNGNIDCPEGAWVLDSDLGPYYFVGGVDSVTCNTPIPPTPEELEAINCFKLQVWQKQCNYAKEVLKYLRLIQFGSICCDSLEELKNKRRALLILNCYDTRDIIGNTTEYNTLTYSEMQYLLEY